jgi:hypothetical protein
MEMEPGRDQEKKTLQNHKNRFILILNHRHLANGIGRRITSGMGFGIFRHFPRTFLHMAFGNRRGPLLRAEYSLEK